MYHKYIRLTNPIEHIEHCRMTWKEYLQQEWVYRFIYTLDIVPSRWYTLVELRRGTREWEELATSFTHTFEFATDNPTIDVALQIMKEKIFEEIPIAATNFHQCSSTIHH